MRRPSIAAATIRAGASSALLLTAALLAAQVPEPRTPAPDDPARPARMRVHYAQALLAHDAVIRGDLAAATAAARALAADPPAATLGAALVPYDAALRATARRAAAASEVTEAAAATALLVTACGDCHRAAGKAPELPSPPPPPVGGLIGHMLEHQHAADKLLQGLARPWTAAWMEGAERLARAPLTGRTLPAETLLRPQILRAEREVHALAQSAAAAPNAPARAAAYGQLLATCAHCHGLHAKAGGPRTP